MIHDDYDDDVNDDEDIKDAEDENDQTNTPMGFIIVQISQCLMTRVGENRRYKYLLICVCVFEKLYIFQFVFQHKHVIDLHQ